jgi:glycosyltransferase involved in cell wall biosynthesis
VFNDIRDLWPDEMVVRAPRWGRTVAKLFSLPLRWQAIEALRKSTGLIAISEAYLSWGLAMTGRQRGPSDQVIPLGYTGQATPDSCPDDVMNRLCASGVDPSRQIFWFCGTFVGNIDLKTVIDAAEILAGNQNLQFVLTGDGERAAEWKAHARNRSNVVFTGWLGAAEIAGMSSMSYVGLAAYKPGASMSLPNKLFEYMSAGLPILSCLAGEAAEVIQANDIGVSYVAGQAVDLADRILDISRDTSTRERQATNARALFQRKYSAQVIYNRYADFLETAACAQLESAS